MNAGHAAKTEHLIWKVPVPHSPVMHSLASASTIAWLIHQKFELGIPLYRQEKEWEALGLSLSRATMSNWLLCVYGTGSPMWPGRLRRELLKQEYLHIDETHLQVLKEPGEALYGMETNSPAVEYKPWRREISGSI